MRFLFFIIITFIITAGTAMPVFAANQFFTSWQANSSAPYFYRGKILPTPGSEVAVAFELLSDGHVVSLPNRLVRWYLDNNLYQSGVGLKTILFTVDQLRTKDYNVRISLPKYDGRTDLDEFLTIPVAQPEVVIDAPYPDRQLIAGAYLLRALPYFFNTTDLRRLTVTWSANGKKTGASANAPDILELVVPPALAGQSVVVGVTVKNSLRPLEFANTTIHFTAQ